ncbi:ABC transporter permease subunit [Bosea sp. 117]|uniref:ABC transporter permease n=1 Tax=Bosea sp. 117 TaxID=1125973 RepID=UPI000494CDA6|nr:ABC transporter permease subunit [Bosea sp. 117]
MTIDALEARRPPASRSAASALLWPAVLAATAILSLAPGSFLPDWAVRLPAGWKLPIAGYISVFMAWLVDQASFGLFTFRELTRGVAWLLDWPLGLAKAMLVSGFAIGQGSQAVPIAPPLPWYAVFMLGVALGWRLGGRPLALLVAGGLAYLLIFGQWASAMTTLASVLVAAPLGAAGGLLLGILCYRSPRFERALSPLLDLAQTVPVFAYLVPILFLFGFGPVSAMIATILYALPPMVRVAVVAFRAVPEEIVVLGRMTGCTRHQFTWKMLVPSARAGLMVGVNQVIMLTLNMVIIASMIGAGGLGYDVLTALRRLDIGRGLEAGLAITVLAILLDRLAQAMARQSERGRVHRKEGAGRLTGRRFWLLVLALAAALWAAAFLAPPLAVFPAEWQLSTASYWEAMVRWINVNFFDALDAFKSFVLLNLLVPVRRFMLGLPWLWVVVVVMLAGWRLGGLRLTVRVALATLFIALVGLWEPAMLTLYLCGVSVLVAAAIGIPIGIACATHRRLWKVVEIVIDTLQTLPSFVYLIPIVMLFRVGDFTAMIAIVLYAVAPAIRYTAHGVQGTAPELIEAGIANGCTRGQLLSRIRLPLAAPQILLGLNQTIMLALSMLVITALVGTRDLGQEVYIALTKADVGRGIVAGLCVAAIAIIADRLIGAGAQRLKNRLGLA